jgi:hypothetical protein
MRQFAIVSLLALMTIVSCAKEKDKKAQSGFGADPYTAATLEGYFNPSSQTPIEVGGIVYSLSSQTNTQLVYQAIQQARMSQIQPLYVNGVAKYRARVTGYVNNIQYANSYQYTNQYNNQYSQQANILTVTAIQFY